MKTKASCDTEKFLTSTQSIVQENYTELFKAFVKGILLNWFWSLEMGNYRFLNLKICLLFPL